jgi:hypothetical protein
MLGGYNTLKMHGQPIAVAFGGGRLHDGAELQCVYRLLPLGMRESVCVKVSRRALTRVAMVAKPSR